MLLGGACSAGPRVAEATCNSMSQRQAWHGEPAGLPLETVYFRLPGSGEVTGESAGLPLQRFTLSFPGHALSGSAN